MFNQSFFSVDVFSVKNIGFQRISQLTPGFSHQPTINQPSTNQHQMGSHQINKVFLMVMLGRIPMIPIGHNQDEGYPKEKNVVNRKTRSSLVPNGQSEKTPIVSNRSLLTTKYH